MDPNFTINPQLLEANIKKVEPVLGISPESTNFVFGIEMIVSMSESTLEKKFEVFRSFGWSDLEILTMARARPYCLKASEAKLQVCLNFVMKELGYTAAYLATHPNLFGYSLEKRVMPSNKVLLIWNEKKLLKINNSLYTVVGFSEDKFMNYYMFPFHERVPHLYETYTNASSHLQTIK